MGRGRRSGGGRIAAAETGRRRRGAWIASAGAVVAGSLVIAMWAPPRAEGKEMRLTSRMARRAIGAVLAGGDSRATRIDACRRLSEVSIACDATVERFTPPSAIAPAVLEVLEGRFTVTLKHDHGLRYMRVHEDR